MRTRHFRRRVRVVLAGLSLLAGLFAAVTSSAAAADAAAVPAPHVPAHVMTIIMENTDYSQFAGSSAMPELNELARQYATFTHAYGWTYPSLPNYLALLSGTDDGTAGHDCDITDNGCGDFTNPTLVDQLDAKGISWNAYYQGLPSGCYQGDGSGNYPYWHNAFRYFKDFKKQCGHISNFSDLLPDLNKANPANFQWVVPDLVNSGGDNGTMSSGDSWLAGELPQIMASRWYRQGGQIVIIFDTGYQDSGGVNGSSGGQIPLVVISGHDAGMGAVKTPVNTAGVLRSIEKVYGLPFLAGARDARNGSLGSALVSGRPAARFVAGPFSLGASLSVSAAGVPRTLGIDRGTISINGIARIVADPIPHRPLPVISVGQDNGHGVVVYPGRGIQVVRGASDLESVSCLFAQCYAVGLAAPNTDEAVLVRILAGKVSMVTPLPAFIGLYGIACTGATCYAVGYDNANDADAVTTITSGKAGPPVEVKGGSEWLNAISCAPSGAAATTTCYAAGLVNYLPSIVPIVNGTPGTPVTAPNAWYLNGIFCTSVGNCAAAGENADEQGIVATLADGKAGPTTVVKGTEYLYGVACLTAGSCVVTGAATPAAAVVAGYSAGVVASFTGTSAVGKVTTVAHSNGFGQAIPYYGRYLTVGAVYLPALPPAR